VDTAPPRQFHRSVVGIGRRHHVKQLRVGLSQHPVEVGEAGHAELRAGFGCPLGVRSADPDESTQARQPTDRDHVVLRALARA